MEIIEKSSLKTKALVIILIATLMVAISTFFCTVKAAEEPKLNRKIEFTGKTYKYPNQDKIRKEYPEGEKGCGIVSIISKSAKHPVYVTGEGWIDIEQIVDGSAVKYIDLKFDNIKNGEFGLKIDGEFVDVDSTNNAVIKFEDGALIATGNGRTDVIITTKEGEEINALATVVEGEVTLSIPDKKVAGQLSATAEIADKVTVEANGDAELGLIIGEDGIGVKGQANGDVVLKVDDNELASAGGNVNGELKGNLNGVTGNIAGEQRINLFQKLTMKLKERASANIDKEQASVTAGGDVAVNDKEIASGDAGLSYTYGEEDPKGSLKAEILDNEIVNVENKTLPIISTLKNLIGKLMAR